MFVAPHLAAAIGAGPDAVTGCRYRVYGSGNNLTRHSFPGGNTGFTRHIVKVAHSRRHSRAPRRWRRSAGTRINFAALDRPANQVRIRLGSTAVRVEHDGEPGKASYVRILYTRGGKAYRTQGARRGHGGRRVDYQTRCARPAGQRIAKPMISFCTMPPS